MEPAGLALSVVGVAGLVSSFIDFLNYVSAANSRDEEYETIQDLFECERGIFIKWVEMYNSHGGNKDKTRVIRALQSDPTVKRIFVRMERLIANGDEMMERYGLRQLNASEEKKFKPISRLFPKLYERLARKKNTLPHRVRWVIRDREKFRVLISDMRFLNNRFESLSNIYDKLEHKNLLHEEISSCSDHDALERISAAHEGSEISDVASRRLTALGREIHSGQCHDYGIDGSVDPSDKAAYMDDARLDNIIRQFSSAINLSSSGTEHIDDYVDDYLDDILHNHPMPFLSGERKIRRDLSVCYGNLISHLREADTKHCENILASLQQYHQRIGLERRMRLELCYPLNRSSVSLLDTTSACTMAPIGDNIYEWRAVIEGPVDSPYEGGIFYIRFKIPRTYPMESPKWRFETKIYHPNISRRSGEAVPDLLELILSNRPWCADQTLMTWTGSIWELLKKPSRDPLHCVEMEVLRQFKGNRTNFDQTAKEWTGIYASPHKQRELSLTPEYEIEKPSKTVVRLENFLSEAAEACSQLHRYLTELGLSSRLEKIFTCSSGILKEIYYVRNSRFIDVLGGEEFARHAASRLHHLSTGMELVSDLSTKLEAGYLPTNLVLDRVAQDLKKLRIDFLDWRCRIEEDLAAKAYRKCVFLEEAFRSAGFRDYKKENPSADLPFPCYQQTL